MTIQRVLAAAAGAALTVATLAHAADQVGASVIDAQRRALAEAVADQGFGPQSPRDLSSAVGSNKRDFAFAPPASRMNLCNIHFHESAEHKGGEFTKYAGHGDGQGYGTGYLYSGELTAAEVAPYARPVGSTDHGALAPGDTIEVHYVYSTAQVGPGPTLGSCLDVATLNPQLRVETQVMVLVNDPAALDFVRLTKHEFVDGYHQAIHIPQDMGTPVQYTGSTTGPAYNETGSPVQVTWSIRPKVAKVSIASVEAWLGDNAFDEDHAHGVRTLVVNPDLLSPMSR
ncbi:MULTISPECIES: delta-class carbonic anhydrase [unclassified Phaeobacter]|uniref:delta-class carbonic anhydrase n=1 Tax=unclassified Phaeobacter TaxID=2621772 RepID=UPI003A8C2422